MNIPTRMLVLTREIGFTERVSATNPFVIEHCYPSSGRVAETSPNWALIIPLAVVLLTAIIAASVFLYRNWRQNNCYPVYCAGAAKYVRKGITIDQAFDTGFIADNWLLEQTKYVKTRAMENGRTLAGLYVDTDFTTKLNLDAKITGPIYIFPKLK